MWIGKLNTVFHAYIHPLSSVNLGDWINMLRLKRLKFHGTEVVFSKPFVEEKSAISQL